jgi:hypothetical protein
VEVVGVLPPEFDRASALVDLWVLRTEGDVSLERLGLGRLKPGVSIEQAKTEIGAIALERGVAPPRVHGDGIDERDASVVGAIGLVALFAGPLAASSFPSGPREASWACSSLVSGWTARAPGFPERPSAFRCSEPPWFPPSPSALPLGVSPPRNSP